MRRLREVTVGVGVIALAFGLALAVSLPVVAACVWLLPGWVGNVVAIGCLLWLAGRLLPPYLRWGHRLAGVPFPVGDAGPQG